MRFLTEKGQEKSGSLSTALLLPIFLGLSFVACSGGNSGRRDEEGTRSYQKVVGACRGCGATVSSTGCSSALRASDESHPSLLQISSLEEIEQLSSAEKSKVVLQISIPGCSACIVQAHNLSHLENTTDLSDTLIAELKLNGLSTDDELINQLELTSEFPQLRVFRNGELDGATKPRPGLLSREELAKILK